jgi:hypothetical protein
MHDMQSLNLRGTCHLICHCAWHRSSSTKCPACCMTSCNVCWFLEIYCVPCDINCTDMASKLIIRSLNLVIKCNRHSSCFCQLQGVKCAACNSFIWPIRINLDLTLIQRCSDRKHFTLFCYHQTCLIIPLLSLVFACLRSLAWMHITKLWD